MNKKMRPFSLFGGAIAVLAAIPTGVMAAKYYEAYELLWLVPFIPAFTVVFFWIIVKMVSLFIETDSYKDPIAIRRAYRFLFGFEIVFLIVLAGYLVLSAYLFNYFKA